MAYDGRGNLTSWGSEVYTYDALGMMTSKNFPEETYFYTADEERLWTFRWLGEFGSLVETWTVRDLDAKVLSSFENPKGDDPWTWLKDYVYRGGQLLAADTFRPGTKARVHFSLDHLGSARLTTGTNGLPVASHHYYPYGEETAVSPDDEPLRFTGHERDFGGGTFDLDYMHARHCSPHLGRFLSVDPIDASSLKSAQPLNKFIFAGNNTVTFIDADGGVQTSRLQGMKRQKKL